MMSWVIYLVIYGPRPDMINKARLLGCTYRIDMSRCGLVCMVRDGLVCVRV